MMCQRTCSFFPVNMKDKIKLLFVCLGNICRSPAAHGIMQEFVDREGLTDRIYVDSAGVAGWHIGELPDRRMRSHAADRGYALMHRGRQFDAKTDFSAFDLILVMDEENYSDITHQAHNETERLKVHYLAEYMQHHRGQHVIPDPYYGGADHFESVIDLIEDACQGVLNAIQDGTIS